MRRCINPGCNKIIPKFREDLGRITCSKVCSNAWNHVSVTLREKLKGKKYNHK